MGGRRGVAGLVMVLGLVASGVVSGCSDDDSAGSDLQGMRGMHSGSPTTGSSADSQAHNDADVSFATDMIPHHAQALLMVDMTEGRQRSADFAALTEQIRAAQTPEIEEMTGWLEDWGEPVPDSTGRMTGGMGGVDGMDGMDGMGGGMMSQDDLDRLEGASRPAFERMWLRMMIAHHEGAVAMSRTEVAEGEYPPAVGLARSIIESQTAEIATMREMLRS